MGKELGSTLKIFHLLVYIQNKKTISMIQAKNPTNSSQATNYKDCKLKDRGKNQLQRHTSSACLSEISEVLPYFVASFWLIKLRLRPASFTCDQNS